MASNLNFTLKTEFQNQILTFEELNYKCSGLYFKNNDNFSDNYLYPFPECRSDYKVNQMKNNGLLNIQNKQLNINTGSYNQNTINDNIADKLTLRILAMFVVLLNIGNY